MLIRVRDGKGHRKRYTLLSQRALVALRQYWRADRPQGWLFPGLWQQRHLTVSSVQRSFAHARRAAAPFSRYWARNATAGIGKPASPHSLRHCGWVTEQP